MNYYALIGLFNGVVVLLASIGILLRKPRIHFFQSFLSFSFSVGAWSIFYAIWQIQTEYNAALFWMRIAMLAVYPSCFGFLWFVMNICGFEKSKAVKIVLIGLPAIFMLFAFSPWMVEGVEPRLQFLFWPIPGNLMHLYAFSFCSAIVISFLLLSMAWARSVGAHKWQIQWIMFSMAPAWVGGSTNWLLWYGVEFPPLPNFFVGVGWLLLTYAMIRTRFFDADVLADYVQEARLSAIGLLTASIHHEIKSPVFVIRGLAEGLAEKEATHKQTLETTTKIIQQTERITEIIRKFREFATRPKGKLIDIQPVNLKSAVKNVLPLVQSQIDAHKIELDVQISEDLSVLVDPYSLEEILLNLILNACQALRDAPRPRIEVKCVLGSETVTITISDNGLGITQRELARIFEPFYTTKKEGTGLGLYVVKQLVARNGGEITVESAERQGTTFKLKLKSVV